MHKTDNEMYSAPFDGRIIRTPNIQLFIMRTHQTMQLKKLRISVVSAFIFLRSRGWEGWVKDRYIDTSIFKTRQTYSRYEIFRNFN